MDWTEVMNEFPNDYIVSGFKERPLNKYWTLNAHEIYTYTQYIYVHTFSASVLMFYFNLF